MIYKNLLITLLLFLLFCLNLQAQIFPNQPKFAGKKIANPTSCSATSTWYYNTIVNEFRVCTATGTPGTWTPLGGGSSVGGLVPSATEGSVFFAGEDGVLAQDNASFFWDDTANQLKIVTGELTTGLLIEAAGSPSYYPRITLKQGGYLAHIGGDYFGDLMFTVSSGKYVSYGVTGVTPAVRINPYPFGANAAPNDEVMRVTSGAAADIPFKIIRHGSQSVDMMRFVDADGTTAIAGHRSNGELYQTLRTPGSSSSACVTGTFTFDTGFLYLCTATNTWKRAALSTF